MNEQGMPTEQFLSSRPIQIQAVSHGGDHNSGPHIQLFALCKDGSIFVQYHSSGYSNVPTDGRWHMIQPPEGFRVSDATPKADAWGQWPAVMHDLKTQIEANNGSEPNDV